MMNWNVHSAEEAPILVNVRDTPALLEDLEQRFQDGEGFSIATINLDHLVKLRQDPVFRKAYTQHSHITSDGNPIVWLSHLAGQGEVTLMPGSDTIRPVLDLAARLGVRVAFFGSTDASLQAAAEALRKDDPTLDIGMMLSPAMGFSPEGPEAEAAVEAIAESGAGLVLLALGAPKQERFAAFAQERLPSVGFMSIGAGLDFFSKRQSRAPVWVRRLAAEWIWRWAGNPRRLTDRYLRCILIIPELTIRALRTRRQG